MEDFQFNLGRAEGRSAIPSSIVPGRARWDDARVSPTPIKLDRGGEEGGIIDRQEKGGPHPLCLVNERENQREESGGEGKRRMRRPTKGGEK